MSKTTSERTNDQSVKTNSMDGQEGSSKMPPQFKLASSGESPAGNNNAVQRMPIQRAEPQVDLDGIASACYNAMFGGFTGFGTDENAVYTALALLKNDAALIAAFKAKYASKYGASIEAHIAAEFSDSFFGNDKTKAMGYLQPKAAPTTPSTPGNNSTPAAPGNNTASPAAPINAPANQSTTTGGTTAVTPLNGSVGGGKSANVVKDLKLVQGKLAGMGYLGAADYQAEGVTLLAGKNDTDKIPSASIPKTIEAIKQFERIVQYQSKPTGAVSASGTTWAMMNVQVATPDMAAISSARQSLNMTVVVGGDLNLSGKVGDVAAGNKDSDLVQVQTRLVAIGYLKSADMTAESPATLKTANAERYKDGMATIDSAHIPKTIAALKTFQTGTDKKTKKFNHEYWKTRKFDGDSLDKYPWTVGQIGEGDLSEYILSHYQKVSYTFKDGEGKDKSVSMDNFTNTAYTVNAAGQGHAGTADPGGFTVEEFKAFGINDTEAKALMWVSKNEGKFNALNTYDKASVSFGFIQFAGGGRSFHTLMATIKKDSPTVFQEKFGKYGIDVEFTEKDGEISSATVVAMDPVNNKVLRGVEAEAYISSSQQLAATFMDAGNSKEVQLAQIKCAVNGYVIPSRSMKFNKNGKTDMLKYKQNGEQVVLFGKAATDFAKSKAYTDLPAADKEALTTFSLEGELVSDYLSSEKARVVIIDQYVNMGGGGAAGALSKGLIDYVTANKQTDKATLKAASETDLLAKIQPYAFVPDRVGKAIADGGLSAG